MVTMVQVLKNALHDKAGPQLLTLLFGLLFMPFYIFYRIQRGLSIANSTLLPTPLLGSRPLLSDHFKSCLQAMRL